MTTFEIIILVLSCIFVAFTFASIIRRSPWWYRVFDFPRIQIWLSLILLLIAGLLVFSFHFAWQYYIIGLLVVSLGYQTYRIFPYTIFSRKQVHRSKTWNEDETLCILISNVKMENRSSQRLLEYVKSLKPDIFLTLESDKWWQSQFESIESDFPYTVKIPRENKYGMHLYSRLKLIDPKQNYFVAEDIPSIEAEIILKDGNRARIFCLHPRPPSPTESPTSVNRDAELLLVADKLNVERETILVFGDLNDVAWSRTTTLFLKVSRLLDPRRGRGFFNTFHAGIFLLRWPLDHIFHTDDFKLIVMKRLGNVGSDHFPVYIKLHYKPRAVKHQEKSGPVDEDEKELKEEKLNRADV
ncbi:MAG: endonuclease/exonuclease/phosphatase family protein [Bacteroidota bacterium]